MKNYIIISLFLLNACSTIQTGNPALDATYSATAAVINNDGVSEKCDHGHEQDRMDCRKRKQKQVDEISKSIKKHTVE